MPAGKRAGGAGSMAAYPFKMLNAVYRSKPGGCQADRIIWSLSDPDMKRLTGKFFTARLTKFIDNFSMKTDFFPCDFNRNWYIGKSFAYCRLSGLSAEYDGIK
jgi:hypothetical protein